MKIYEANIPSIVRDFFKKELSANSTILEINILLKTISGINNFFETETEFIELKDKIVLSPHVFNEPDRAEYGDFQTNAALALNITQYLSTRLKQPEVLIEPTCGKGNFIVAALQSFHNLEKIYGIEIYKPYVWETKFSILNYFLQNTNQNKPEINICNTNVFDFDFVEMASLYNGKDILVIGNPPWVTNSMLGSLSSLNLPSKSNFKNHNGLDAMTGKGNFDIAESITLMLLDAFQSFTGNLVLLVKNSVIKNLLFDQKKNKYRIGKIEKHCIDSKKEFNVSVEAAMFFCELNDIPSFECNEFDFYNNRKSLQSMGWVNDKFVSNMESYVHSKQIDGISPFEWRQGLKHDCSSIMELDKVNGHYVNGLSEETKLEENLVYGLLKSSDLKNTIINTSRKYIIVTQNKVGQDTFYIKRDYPKTYDYLLNHQMAFAARKSSIYLGKPLFSIFGIGDYSFKPYKVVISGLYKTFHFTLVLPQNNKPMMLDDTCYMLAFDNIDFAAYTLVLLNSRTTKEFLKSITFSDAKRTFTKDVLMRIDLHKLSSQFTEEKMNTEIQALNIAFNLTMEIKSWNSYLKHISPAKNGQMEMFPVKTSFVEPSVASSF